MTYRLAIGDRTYSSWSLRGWLLFEKFGIPVRVDLGVLYTDSIRALLEDYAPARLVPAMRTPEGEVVGETIAIAETLAERHPDAGLWPADPAARMMARYMAAEMHAGFGSLRSACPMNLAKSYADSAPTDAVLADLARIERIWGLARARFGATAAGGSGQGPWLFGAYCAADAFFAPVATRIATYNLPVGPDAAAYVAAHLADPAFRRWRAAGLAVDGEQPSYRMPYDERPWPFEPTRKGVPLPAPPEGEPANALCPYSGKPATHFLRLDDRVWGFCCAACRDKTASDPDAWPAFLAMESGDVVVNQS